MTVRWYTTRRDRQGRTYKELHRRLALELEAPRNQEPGKLVWWVFENA